MSDALTDYYRAQKQWDRAELLLSCYLGLNQQMSKEEAKNKIEQEFKKTPEQLEKVMRS